MRIHAKHVASLTVVMVAALGAIAATYASGPAFFSWDVPPTAVTTFYERQEIPPGCEFCDPVIVQGIRSKFTGGVYGVDADGDGTRDGSLTAEIEVVSEVLPTSGGQFLYTWQLSNLGSGALIAFVGSGPDFGISITYPLLGTAGPDRLTGTLDDLAVGLVATRSFVGGPPTTYAWGGVLNPSTGLGGTLYGPASNPPMLAITIDVKPGESPNAINPKPTGNIPVAILTTSTFDAATVNPTTVRFGPTGVEAFAVNSTLEDVDGDTHPDLVLQFASRDAGIRCGNSSAIITGQTFSGQKLEGIDSIVTVGCR